MIRRIEEHNMRKKMIWMAPLAIAAMVLFTWIGGELVMRLWNWLLPTLFGWRQISFWQGLGLLALCRILFGGFRLSGHGSPRSNIRRRIKERMDARWERMTPEEREKFRQSFRGRCSPFEPPDTKPTA
jgi:hypothetical protein